MLDINLFRSDKGNDPERVRESQRRRFASVELVDEIIELDKEWRQRTFSSPNEKALISSLFPNLSLLTLSLSLISVQFELSNLQKDFNRINKEVARLKIVSFFPFDPILLGFCTRILISRV